MNQAEHSHTHGHGSLIGPGHPAGAVRGLIVGMILNLAIVVVEVIVGLASGSLGLLSDAVHNFTDMAALGITWFAIEQAKRPPTAARTFGFHRTGILVALINALSMVLVTLWIFWEAYHRLLDPQPVDGIPVMVTAALALAANLMVALRLRGHAAHDINIRSAVLHLVGDAAASAAVVVSGLVIALTGWDAADPLVSILLGVLILWGAWRIIRETVEIFLEQSPRAVDVDRVVAELMREDGVKDIHDMHIWTIGSGIYALSCHVLVEDVKVSESSRIMYDLKQMLRRDFNITHSTLEVETDRCAIDGKYCDINH